MSARCGPYGSNPAKINKPIFWRYDTLPSYTVLRIDGDEERTFYDRHYVRSLHARFCTRRARCEQGKGQQLYVHSHRPFFHSEKPQVHPPIIIQEGMYLFKRTVANELEGEHSVKGV